VNNDVSERDWLDDLLIQAGAAERTRSEWASAARHARARATRRWVPAFAALGVLAIGFGATFGLFKERGRAPDHGANGSDRLVQSADDSLGLIDQGGWQLWAPRSWELKQVVQACGDSRIEFAVGPASSAPRIEVGCTDAPTSDVPALLVRVVNTDRQSRPSASDSTEQENVRPPKLLASGFTDRGLEELWLVGPQAIPVSTAEELHRYGIHALAPAPSSGEPATTQISEEMRKHVAEQAPGLWRASGNLLPGVPDGFIAFDVAADERAIVFTLLSSGAMSIQETWVKVCIGASHSAVSGCGGRSETRMPSAAKAGTTMCPDPWHCIHTRGSDGITVAVATSRGTLRRSQLERILATATD
jgi:hypothetical protein